MENKLKILGLGNLELKGDIPELEKEYLLSLVVEREGKATDEKDKDNPIDIYKMRYLRTELMMEIGSKKKLEVINGKTPSQKLRFVIEALGKVKGIEDTDKFYQEEMSKIINHFEEKLK